LAIFCAKSMLLEPAKIFTSDIGIKGVCGKE
jgi:hypothetical protein